jgi:hypothetical protein
MLTNMNNKSDRLEVEDGALFAVSCYFHKQLPQRVEHWWKLYGFDGRPLDPQFINVDSGAIYKDNGRYCVHHKTQGWVDVFLQRGKDSVAEKVTLTSIPRPSGREATRWHEGHWQKFVRKAWVDV